jgi:hypothetical protein
MLEGKTVDAAEPPRIVFENPAQCRESDRAEELLRRALTAKAPGPGWSVAMRVDRSAPKGLRAEGEITDGDGVSVGRRIITGPTADCGGLARAVGVWASLVLDAELRRSRAIHGSTGATIGTAATTPPPDVRGAVPTVAGGGHGGSGSGEGGGGSGGGGGGASVGEASSEAPVASPTEAVGTGPAEPVTAWPAPAPVEKPSPEHDWYLHHDDVRTLEVGAGMFLGTGAGGGAVVGPSAFVVIEAGNGLFLRPALAFGKSLSSLPPSDVNATTWTAARFDTCVRMPGLYTRHHGMQLDLCGGTDIGMTTVDSSGTTATVPYWDIGPSLDLRGELGSRLSAVLRAVAGIDVLSESFRNNSDALVRVPIVDGRLELAFSWDVR